MPFTMSMRRFGEERQAFLDSKSRKLIRSFRYEFNHYIDEIYIYYTSGYKRNSKRLDGVGERVGKGSGTTGFRCR